MSRTLGPTNTPKKQDVMADMYRTLDEYLTNQGEDPVYTNRKREVLGAFYGILDEVLLADFDGNLLGPTETEDDPDVVDFEKINAIYQNLPAFALFVNRKIKAGDQPNVEELILDFADDRVVSAAVTIQRGLRGLYEYREREKTAAAIKIQANFRGHQQRENIIHPQIAAKRIQKAYRANLAQKKALTEVVEPMQRQIAAIKIQALWKGYAVRRDNKKLDANAKRIRDGMDIDFPQTHSRESLVEKELAKLGKSFEYDAKRREFVEKPVKKDELKNKLSYTIAGYSRENKSKSTLNPHDHIVLNKSGLHVAEYNLSENGAANLSEHLETARVIAQGAKRGDKSYVLVKMTGAIEKPLLGPNGEIQVDRDGKTILAPEVDAPYSIIHQDGASLVQTFVKKSLVEDQIKLSDEEYSARSQQLVKAALIQLKDEKDGPEKDEKVALMVRSALRSEAEKRFEKVIESSKEQSEIHYNNSQEALKALREAHPGKFKGSRAKSAVRHIGTVANPNGPEGISITKAAGDPYSVKVLFRCDNPESEIYDKFYVAMPNTPCHVRVQRARAAGDVITRYVDGIKQDVVCKEAGEVVMDVNTIFHYNAVTKGYDPIKVHNTREQFGVRHQGSSLSNVPGFFSSKVFKSGPDNLVRLKNYFRAPGDADRIMRAYDKMNIQVVSMTGPNMHTVLKMAGKSKPISAEMGKVATVSFDTGERIKFAKKLPEKAALYNDPWPQKAEEFVKIPQFGLDTFGQEGDQENAALRQKAAQELKLKVVLNKGYREGNAVRFYNEDGSIRTENLDDSSLELLGKSKQKEGSYHLEYEIFDQRGNPLSEKEVVDRFGEKFLQEIRKTTPKVIIVDEFKKKEKEFLKAVESGDLATVQRLFKEYKAKEQEAKLLVLNSKDQQGSVHDEFKFRAKLMATVMENNCFNAFCETSTLSGSMNALHIAAKNGDEEMVQFLRGVGFDPSVQTSNNKTAQQLALDSGFKKDSHKTLMTALETTAQNKKPLRERNNERFAQILALEPLKGADILTAEKDFLANIQAGDYDKIAEFIKSYKARSQQLEGLAAQASRSQSLTDVEQEAISQCYGPDFLVRGVDGKNALTLARESAQNARDDVDDDRAQHFDAIAQLLIDNGFEDQLSKSKVPTITDIFTLATPQYEYDTDGVAIQREQGGFFQNGREVRGGKGFVKVIVPIEMIEKYLGKTIGSPGDGFGGRGLLAKDLASGVNVSVQLEKGELIVAKEIDPLNLVNGLQNMIARIPDKKAFFAEIEEMARKQIKFVDQFKQAEAELRASVSNGDGAKFNEVLYLYENNKEAGTTKNIDLSAKGEDGKDALKIALENGRFEIVGGRIEGFAGVLIEMGAAVSKEHLEGLSDDVRDILSSRIADQKSTKYFIEIDDGDPRMFSCARYVKEDCVIVVQDHEKGGEKSIKCKAGDLVVEDNSIYVLGGAGLVKYDLIKSEHGTNPSIQDSAEYGASYEDVKSKHSETLSSIMSVEKSKHRKIKAENNIGKPVFKEGDLDNEADDFPAQYNIPKKSISHAVARQVKTFARGVAPAA